jgi:Replicative DNA helicase
MQSSKDEATEVPLASLREIIRRSMDNAAQVAEYEGFWSPTAARAPFAAEPPAAESVELTGIATGFRDVDALLGGLQSGQLTVLAGAGSSGLSTFVQNVARKVGRAEADAGGRAVIFVSFGASQAQVAHRMLCAEARVDPHALSQGRLRGPEEWERLTQAAERLSRAPVFVTDDRGMGPAELQERCAHLAATMGLGLVVVDPLETLGVSPEGRRRALRHIVPALKETAEHFAVPVLATHTREVVPTGVASLPASVQLHADILALLHRPDVWFPVGRDDQDYYEAQKGLEIVDFVVVGGSGAAGGRTGTARLGFYTRLARFDDIRWEPEGE